MIRLINRDTGGETWVHESRLEEYLKAGHRMAEPPKPPEKKRRKPLSHGGKDAVTAPLAGEPSAEKGA